MRQYRGLTKDGKWVYGSLIIHNAYNLNDGTHKPYPEHMFIKKQDIEWVNDPDDKRWTFLTYQVLPETVGQQTGLKDKNGREIYEGDIMEFYSACVPKGTNPLCKEVVNWNKKGLYYEGCWSGKVIGNIHENPDLLEKP